MCRKPWGWYLWEGSAPAPFGWTRCHPFEWAMDTYASYTWLLPNTGWTVWTWNAAACGPRKALRSSLLLVPQCSLGSLVPPQHRALLLPYRRVLKHLAESGPLRHHDQFAHTLNQKGTRTKEAGYRKLQYPTICGQITVYVRATWTN